MELVEQRNLLRAIIPSKPTTSGVQVIIGKENKVVIAPEFSTIVSSINLHKKKEGVVVILGPKRMAYDKNVGIMNSLIKLLQ